MANTIQGILTDDLNGRRITVNDGRLKGRAGIIRVVVGEGGVVRSIGFVDERTAKLRFVDPADATIERTCFDDAGHVPWGRDRTLVDGYPHAGGCAGCREHRVCNVCGGDFDRVGNCTNGRCGRCHQAVCTMGGATSPGHGFGGLGDAMRQARVEATVRGEKTRGRRLTVEQQNLANLADALEAQADQASAKMRERFGSDDIRTLIGSGADVGFDGGILHGQRETYRLVAATIRKLAGLALLLLALLPGLAAADHRPNVVLLIADDMRADDVARTPALADLAANGTSFARAFAGYPLCTPARATILSGQLPRTHGVVDNHSGTFDPSSTWATWLHGAGYETHLVGKYLNKLHEVALPVPGWDDFRAMPKHTTYGRAQSDVLAAQASDVIATAAEPFALVVGFASPHGPQAGPVRFDAAVPPALDIGPALDPLVADRATTVWNRRWRGLQGVSDAVDTIRAALDARGITGRTLVVFTSDQGFAVGELGAFGKMDWHEWVLRVPLIVSGPGVPAGDVRRGIVSHADLAPTFAALAGVEPPAGLYGRALQPILAADRDDWRNRVEVDGPGWTATRKAQSKVVRFADGREARVDLAADPRELSPVLVQP